MCIVALAWQLSDRLPLVLLSNRDEFFHRDSLPAHLWADGIFAGKDVEKGGTWLGIHPKKNKWAVILNYRDLSQKQRTFSTSRGQIVRDYLTGELSPLAFARRLDLRAYDGFNLIIGDEKTALVLNNQGHPITPLAHGLHVLSNGQPDTPWHKCERLRQRVAQEILPLIATDQDWHDAAFDILKDPRQAPTDRLPHTGLSAEAELALSSIFIPKAHTEGVFSYPYGTQVSSLVSFDGTLSLIERWHQP